MDKISQHYHGRKLLLAMMIVGTFAVAELICSIMGNSVALIADSGHMFSDCIALFLSWLGERYYDYPADEKRSFGYQRLRVIIAYTNGILLAVLVAMLFVEAVQALLKPTHASWQVMLGTSVVSILVNCTIFRILHGESKLQNMNMRSIIAHVISDMLGAGAAIVAALLIWYTGLSIFDPLLSLVTVALIARIAFKLLRDAAHILLEGAPTKLGPEDVTKLLEGKYGIQEVHHVHLWLLSDDYILATMHIVLEEDIDCETMEDIKRLLSEKLGINHVTVEKELRKCA